MSTRPSFWNFSINYGWRSLGRNLRRSILMISVVVVAVSVAIVARSYARAVFKLWIDSTVDTGAGHVQFHAADFSRTSVSLEDKHLIDARKVKSLTNKLGDHKHVRAVAPRLLIEGVASAHGRSLYFLGQGVDPQLEIRVAPRTFSNVGDSGRFLNSKDEAGVVLGKGLATYLGIGLGETITLAANTSQQNLNAREFVVVGIVDFPQSQFSRRLVYLPLKAAQDLVRVGGKIDSIVVRLKENIEVDQWLKKNKNLWTGMAEEPWWEIFPPILKIQGLWHGFVSFVVAILFLAAAVSVVNVVYIVLNERIVEIGTLRSLGARGSAVVLLLAAENAIVGALGALIGLVIAVICILFMDGVGMPLPNPFFQGFIYVHPKIAVGDIILILPLAVFVCALAALLPARRASRLEPVVAFRGQAMK